MLHPGMSRLKLTFFWLFLKFYYLLELNFSFIATSNVPKGRFRIIMGNNFCSAFSKIKDTILPATTLHFSHQEKPKENDE